MSLSTIKRTLKRLLGVKAARFLSMLNRMLFPRKADVSELAYIKHVLDYVENGDFVLDIGANEGLWTKALSDKVGSGGKVFAFEPVRETYQTLLNNTRQLKNVSYYNIGLSDKTGTAEIFRDPVSQAPPSAAIVDTAVHITDMKSLVKETIKINTLDEVSSEFETSISFMKIDVEGHEKSLLSGALNFMKDDRPVIFIEILREYWYGSGMVGKSKAADLILQTGYVMYQVTPSGIIKNSSDFQLEFENFLFLSANS
jgi:FkbM family methyltransferase